MQIFESKASFQLEGGEKLPALTLAYFTYGKLNETRDNVIWVCHALTASADVQNWWPSMVGPGLAFDTNRFFVIGVNIPGSCYGSTGPLSAHPLTGKPYYHSFPLLTIRDMVRSFQLLAAHLQLRAIQLLAGGSMGGYQVLEWALMQPGFIRNIFLIATSARESAWRIAIHTAQRMAIETDGTWKEDQPDAGKQGLQVARAIGMLTYRHSSSYERVQTDPDMGKLQDFKVSSYMRYQGEKLSRRFNAFSYWQLTRSMDTHNIARGRSEEVASVLKDIRQQALVMGIQTDILCPPEEQAFLAEYIPNAELVIIESDYGHDGFLVESSKITQHLSPWLECRLETEPSTP